MRSTFSHDYRDELLGLARKIKELASKLERKITFREESLFKFNQLIPLFAEGILSDQEIEELGQELETRVQILKLRHKDEFRNYFESLFLIFRLMPKFETITAKDLERDQLVNKIEKEIEQVEKLDKLQFGSTSQHSAIWVYLKFTFI